LQKSKSIKKPKLKRKPDFEKSRGNIFADLGFSASEAINIAARLDLIIQIERIIKRNGWTQQQAAAVLEISQSRVCELMKSKTELFTVDKLMLLLDKLGKEVRLSIRNKTIKP